MTTTQLILLLLLVVVVVLAVFWLMRRGSAKDDAARVEAEELRGRAQEIAAAIGGQQTFAEQAEERAAVAKAEAEARAAEATRLEEEAAAQRAVVAETQREYEAQMRRADEIDPDVQESAYAAPVEEDVHAAPAAAAEPEAAPAEHDATEEEPQTRAERRAAREQAGSDSPWGAHAAPAAAAAAGAAGASTWGARDHADDHDPDSERVASAADYRDDVAPEGDRPVSEPAALGTAAGMADETSAPTRDHDDEQTDLSHGTATPSGEWGGPHDPERDSDDVTAAADTGSGTDTDDAPAAGDATAAEPADGGVTIIDNIEDFAATEPVLAEDQTAPVEPETATGAPALAEADEVRTAEADDEPSDAATEADAATDTDAEVPAAEAPVAAEAPAATEDRFDPTPERDWAADEGELLEENSERAGALEEERHDLDADASSGETPAATADEPSADDRSSVVDGPTAAASVEDVDTQDLPRQDDEGSGERVARRISGFDELRDGGYGVGSAATLHDGAQPLDHAIAGYRESMTFRSPGDAGYDDTDPDVWFYDEGAAERSGFRRAEG